MTRVLRIDRTVRESAFYELGEDDIAAIEAGEEPSDVVTVHGLEPAIVKVHGEDVDGWSITKEVKNDAVD